MRFFLILLVLFCSQNLSAQNDLSLAYETSGKRYSFEISGFSENLSALPKKLLSRYKEKQQLEGLLYHFATVAQKNTRKHIDFSIIREDLGSCWGPDFMTLHFYNQRNKWLYTVYEFGVFPIDSTKRVDIVKKANEVAKQYNDTTNYARIYPVKHHTGKFFYLLHVGNLPVFPLIETKEDSDYTSCLLILSQDFSVLREVIIHGKIDYYALMMPLSFE